MFTLTFIYVTVSKHNDYLSMFVFLYTIQINENIINSKFGLNPNNDSFLKIVHSVKVFCQFERYKIQKPSNLKAHDLELRSEKRHV